MSSANVESAAKTAANALYNAGLIAAGVGVSRIGMKKFGMKDRPIDFKLKSMGMLAVEIAIATYVVKTLRDSKMLPDKIIV